MNAEANSLPSSAQPGSKAAVLGEGRHYAERMNSTVWFWSVGEPPYDGKRVWSWTTDDRAPTPAWCREFSYAPSSISESKR